MNRISQAVIMLLFGGAIIKATLTDVFLRYVKEGLRPFLLTAGLLLVTTAIMTVWYELRALVNNHGPGQEQQHDDGHGHVHHEPRVGWLLLLPVLGLLLISPPALGSYAAGQAGSVGPAAASEYPPLAETDPVEVGLLDYASRAVFDSGKSLARRNVKLTGFVTPGPNGEPMLARMVLACCAADGRPIKIGLTGAAIDAPVDAWIEVVGVYSTRVGTDPVNQAQVAYIEVRTWQAIEEPKQPYA